MKWIVVEGRAMETQSPEEGGLVSNERIQSFSEWNVQGLEGAQR